MSTKIILITFLLISANFSIAIEAPNSGQVRSKEFRSPILNTNEAFEPIQNLAFNKRADISSKIKALGIQPESAYIDVRNDKFGTLLTSVPLIPGKGKNNHLKFPNHGLNKNKASTQELKQQAWNAFINYLDANRSILNIDITQMQDPGTVTVLNDGDLIQINSKRSFNGVLVRDSFISAVINNGNLILTGTRNWGDINLSISPGISKDQAKSTVENYLGVDSVNANWGKSGLLFIPVNNGAEIFKLVHTFHVTFNNESIASWEAMVDAHSNELIAFEDKTAYAETRQLEGGQFPVSNDGVAPDGVEVISPMPFADLTVDGETYFTDTGGNVLACLEGDSTTTLNGRYITMQDSCGSFSETASGPIQNLGTSAGTDCAIPAGASAGNTHSTRSGYYELNRMIEVAQSYLPDNSWLKNPVVSNMNTNDNCNAGYTINQEFVFFTSGGGCNNTGEIAGVFDHEWGHGMDDHDANPGIQNPGEGIADTYASLRLNTSCIGRNFKPGVCDGFGDPCTECTGVRDIDWAKHSSGVPHDLDWVNATCFGSVHCRGQIIGETIYDLWNRDLTAAPYNMDSNTAREFATLLTFQGSGPVGLWYTDSDGCNADGGYLNFLAADDDDGDLTNGTPHMAAIFASFDRHGIACPTPVVQDSGCENTPTAATTVSIVSSDRTNILSWQPIAGAMGYRVYRTEGVMGCDFGKVLIAETTNLSHLDAGLSNGREYYYTVIPIGSSTSCFGPSSSCSTGIPVASANLAIDSTSTLLTINSGDNDNNIDNCESASVTFDIANVGTILATNVTVSSISSPSHPSIDASIVASNVSPNSFADCSTGSTGFSFDAQDLVFGDVLEFDVCITSDEIAPVSKCGIISYSNVQSNEVFLPSLTYDFEQDEGWQVIQGTFDRTSGDSSGTGTFATRSSSLLNGQCDEIISPDIKLSATSTLSVDTNYDIENISGGTWWDRANVSLVFENGSSTVISPDAGRQYNASGNYPGCNSGQPGWASSEESWDSSTWSSSALNSVANQNQSLKLKVNYATDNSAVGRGFWFDKVTLTDVTLSVEEPEMCGPDLYSISGTVNGLVGAVTIQNNGTDDITISDSDPQIFQFPIQIADGGPYAVSVFAQPSSPDQNCVVTGGDIADIGSGNVSGQNVNNILVTCTTDTYTVSGTVSGATGPVTLTNNGTDPQVVNANGAFSFSAQNDETGYLVAVSAPATQTCSITGGENNNGSGSIDSNNVNNIVVTCLDNFSTAVDDSLTVLEDSLTTSFNVLNNDSTSVNGPAPIIAVSDPNNGTSAIINNDNDLSYMPDADYCNSGASTDDFSYTITGGSSADVQVEVTCVNDAPTFDIDENVYVKLSEIEEGVADNVVACNVNLGPGNENTEQSIDGYAVEVLDPDNAIDTISVSNAGVLNATYTGNPGTATVNLTLKDDGGVANSGEDSTTKQMTIQVLDIIFKGGFELETCQ
ncbi:MAG: hypothetical protein AB8B80_00685 [Marinicellaceae bacterium]